MDDMNVNVILICSVKVPYNNGKTSHLDVDFDKISNVK